MTLLLFHAHQKDFVIATGDTRCIKKFIDRNTLEESDMRDVVEDVHDKVEQLTNSVLISTGGNYRIGRDWKEFMATHSKKEYFLDDLEDVMKASYEFLKVKGMKNAIYTKDLDSGRFGAHLIGFYKDGSTGMMVIYDKQIQTLKVEESEVFQHIYAPTKDLLENKDSLMDYSKSQIINDNDLDTVVNHFAKVQSLVSLLHEDLVSNRFMAICLTRHGEKIRSTKIDWDLTETQNILKSTL